MIRKIQKGIQSETGVIFMASTLGIFVLLSFFAFFLARFAATETRSSAYHVMDIKTRNLALTGTEHALQSFKAARNTASVSGDFNTGSYEAAIDTLYTENNTSLPYTNYITINSSAAIGDLERNLRLIVSSMPEAFCFSYYGNNAGGVTFAENTGSIVGDIYHNGSVNTSIVSSGIKYNSVSTDDHYLDSPPSFPTLSTTLYEDLLTSAASASSSSTYDNYALDFDGSDYVGIGGHNDINNYSSCAQKTIEAWFRTNNKSSSTKQIIYEQGGGTRGLNIYIQSGTLYVGGWNRRTVQQGESNWNPGTYLSTNSINNNQWHHVALTLNGGSTVSANVLKMYLDGNYISSGDGSRLWNHNPANIGRTRSGSRYHNNITGNGYTFNGKIDEVRIWNVERTASQIAAKKDTILAGNESDLTAYYNFQENTGSTANDSQTQSNNDGSISGASWTDGPPLIKLAQSSYTNTTINLSSYTNSQLLHNGDLTITGTTVNGPGYLVVYGDLSIESSSMINKNVFLICSGNLTIASSTVGTGIRAPVILYAKGIASVSSSTIYGLIIARGSSCTLDQTAIYGGILNFSATFSLSNSSSVTGSVVSDYSIDLTDTNSSITKGSLPPFFGLNIGLDPMVVPGSYLEH